MTDERVKGTLNKAKGVIKEDVGKLTGDRSTEAAGKADQAKGTVQNNLGDAKAAVRNQDNRNR